MSRWIQFLVACSLFALPALAGDGYQFHLRVTDARTGLLANPKFDELKISLEQLERAANDRVLLFDHATGGHWMWLMLGWPAGKPAIEQGINGRGGAAPGHGADIGLIPQENGTIRARCYRERCDLRVVTPDRKETTAALKNGEESKDLPLDSDFHVSLEDK